MENSAGKEDGVGSTTSLTPEEPEAELFFECDNLVFACEVTLSVQVRGVEEYEGAVLWASNGRPQDWNEGAIQRLLVGEIELEDDILPIGVGVGQADPLTLDGANEYRFTVPASEFGSVLVRRVEFLAPSNLQVRTLRLRVTASW